MAVPMMPTSPRSWPVLVDHRTRKLFSDLLADAIQELAEAELTAAIRRRTP